MWGSLCKKARMGNLPSILFDQFFNQFPYPHVVQKNRYSSVEVLNWGQRGSFAHQVCLQSLWLFQRSLHKMSNVPLGYHSTCMARAQFYLSQEAAILGFPVFSITIPLKNVNMSIYKNPVANRIVFVGRFYFIITGRRSRECY